MKPHKVKNLLRHEQVRLGVEIAPEKERANSVINVCSFWGIWMKKSVFNFIIYMNHVMNFIVFSKPNHNSQKMKWLD